MLTFPDDNHYKNNGLEYFLGEEGRPTVFSLEENGNTEYFYETNNNIHRASDDYLEINEENLDTAQHNDLYNRVSQRVLENEYITSLEVQLYCSNNDLNAEVRQQRSLAIRGFQPWQFELLYYWPSSENEEMILNRHPDINESFSIAIRESSDDGDINTLNARFAELITTAEQSRKNNPPNSLIRFC